MQKKRLAFIDYWSHQNTKSGDFLREIFSKEFEITDFWWKPNERIPLEEIDEYEYIFFFHVIFPHQILRKLKKKKIMWAPMYDALNFRNFFFKSIFWKQIASLGVKVLKFSNKVTESIGKEDININSLKLNYFIKPNFNQSYNQERKLNIFFWDRGRIKINDWLHLFNKEEINELVYLPRPDPGIKDTTYDDLKSNKDLNIKLMDKKYIPKNEYLKIFEKCNVFIAPRKKEGIGITIVEAISRGMFIIGYNDSTMNEYILNKKVGLLFNKETKEKIALKDIVKHYNFRKSYAEINYDKWSKDKEKIIPLLKEDNKSINSIYFFPLFLIDDLRHLIKRVFKINYYY